MQLPGRRVLVTGASRGIGAAVAATFAAAGADVVAAARDEARISELASRIGGTAVVGDLTRPEPASGLIEAAGPVDILVNNAGLEDSAYLPEQDPAAIDA